MKYILIAAFLLYGSHLPAQVRAYGLPGSPDTTVSPSPDTGKKSSSAAAQQGDTARKPVSRRSQVRIPVSPKENDYPAQARKTEKDKTLVPSPAATTVSSAFEKPSWWKRNKKWALPTAIGVGALLGVKCAQGGFICGKTELKSNTEVTVIR